MRGPLILLLVFLASPAAAETEREKVQERRAAVERDLDAVAGERAQVKTRAARLARDVARLREDMKRAAKAMQARRRAVSAAADAAVEAEAAAGTAAAAIARRRRELSGLLGAMARLTLRPPEALAALKDGPEQAAKASLALRMLLPEVERRIDAARTALAEAAALKQAHLDRLAAARAATDALKRERRALDRAVAEKRRLMRRVKAAGTALTLRVAKLEDEAATLDTFFRAMIAREAAVDAARASQAAVARARELNAAHRHALARRPDAGVPPAASDTSPSTGAGAAPEAGSTLPEGPPLRLAGLAKARGQAAAPVAGRVAAGFGEGAGVLSRGLIYQASAAAEVFTPYDGRIAYAGPFRGYGDVVLIDHGDGYHTLLTGLGHVTVAAGDWVLQGEPLGALPRGAVARASGPGGPKLYVELRKDGEPVDPAPWFARPT